MDWFSLDKNKTGNTDGRSYSIDISHTREYSYKNDTPELIGFSVKLEKSKLHLFRQVNVGDYVTLNEEGMGSSAIIHHLQVESINTSPKIMTMYLKLV
jgi:hypothetical protein